MAAENFGFSRLEFLVWLISTSMQKIRLVPKCVTHADLSCRTNSFSSWYLILGDFNGHSHLWGANQENERGKIVEKLIDRHNLILLNDSVHTRFDTYHQTSSLLDISLCHPSIYMDVACEISSDRLGSDHHPIIITANTSDHPVPERVPKWNFKKAKWDAFQDQCITEITPNLFNDAEDQIAIFSSTLLDIAADNIPKTSPFWKRKAKPWFDEDCQAAKKERNKANRLANKHPSAANSMRACLIQARTKKLFKQKKRDSWKNMYLQSMLIPLLRRFGIWCVKSLEKCSEPYASLKRWQWNSSHW